MEWEFESPQRVTTILRKSISTQSLLNTHPHPFFYIPFQNPKCYQKCDQRISSVFGTHQDTDIEIRLIILIEGYEELVLDF